MRRIPPCFTHLDMRHALMPGARIGRGEREERRLCSRRENRAKPAARPVAMAAALVLCIMLEEIRAVRIMELVLTISGDYNKYLPV